MPEWAREVRARLSPLRLSPTREAEIVEELSQHLQDRYAELIAGGALPEDARRLALDLFQNDQALARYLAPLRQAHPTVSFTQGEPTGSGMSDVWLDARYAVRQALMQPGFTAIVVATLAVCIAANVAIFAVVDAVVLRPLPFPEGDRLVAIYNTYPGAGVDIAPNSAVDFYDRQRLATLEQLATYRRVGLTVDRGAGDPERVASLITSPSLFPLIGAHPLLGRLLLDADTQPGAHQKVLLTYGYWQRAFAGRETAVGETLRVNGAPFTVVGVLPAGWRFIDPTLELVIPAVFTAEERLPTGRHRNNNWQQVGRLTEGATLESLQSEIDALNAANLEETPPDLRQPLADIGFTTRVAPFQRFVVGQAARSLYFLWGGVVVVLLIGGVNLANMVLVRATAQRREWATRLALGAGAGRLLRQSLIEWWMLTATGAVGGLLLGAWALRLAPSLALEALPRGTEIAVDGRVFVFVVTISGLIGTALGLLPRLAYRPTQVTALMREEGRTGTPSRPARLGRRVLAAAQVACALMLLVAGGVLLASLQRVLAVDLGFRSDRLLTAQLTLPPARYATTTDRHGFVNRLLERLRQLPGIEAAGLASTTPFGGATTDNVILAEGYQMAPGESVISVYHVSVSSGYFEAIGARLLAGRWFDEGDVEGRRRVIIIDERLARRFFPDGDAVGRRMWALRGTDLAPPPEDEMLTVVGVVAEMRLADVVDDPGMRSNGATYYPYSQQPASTVGLAIRTIGEPTSIVNDVRRILAELDPELPLYEAQRVSDLIDRSLIDRRTPAVLAAGFALVALLLASLGVYGVLAYQVSQRTREIGIRMALGSDASRIFRLVLTEGVVLVGAGALAGLAGAVALRRTLEAQLYGIEVMDPLVLVTVVTSLAVVALIAIAIPARRAARTNPITALNQV